MQKLLALASLVLLIAVGCSAKSLGTAQEVARYNRVASAIVDDCLSATVGASDPLARLCAEVTQIATGDAEPDYPKLVAYVVGVALECFAATEPHDEFAEACIEIKAALLD